MIPGPTTAARSTSRSFHRFRVRIIHKPAGKDRYRASSINVEVESRYLEAINARQLSGIQTAVRRKIVSKLLRVLFVFALFCATAAAQKVDLALTVGAYHPVHNSYNTDTAFAVEGNFGYQVFSVPFIGLYFEVPVAGTLDSAVPV